jgi:acyl carrier protein
MMIQEKLTQILVEEFEIEEQLITPEADLREDIGIDSLDVVDMVVVINEEFGIKLQAQDFKGVKTFGQLVELLDKRSA